MSSFQFFLLAALILEAPHLNRSLANGASLFCIAVSLVFLLIDILVLKR